MSIVITDIEEKGLRQPGGSETVRTGRMPGS